MTPKQYERLVRRLIDRWIDRLNLNHYMIGSRVVDRVGGNDTTYGETELMYGHRRAYIDIKAGLEFDMLRDTIVHELVHCVFKDTLMSVRQLRDAEPLSDHTWDVFDKQWSMVHENDISQMTKALCGLCSDDDLKPKPKE